VLTIARLIPQKNLNLALHVMSTVIATRPSVGYIIVGDGPQKNALLRRAKKLGIAENVLFAGYDDNLSNYFRAADAFLFTSNYEGYSLTLMEVAFAGIPIVTTDVGIAPQLIEEGTSGFMCQTGDATCLIDRLLLLLENDEQRELLRLNMADAARRVLPSKEEYLRLLAESWKRAVA